MSPIGWRKSGAVTTCNCQSFYGSPKGVCWKRKQFCLFLCQTKPTAPVFRQSKCQSFWHSNLDFSLMIVLFSSPFPNFWAVGAYVTGLWYIRTQTKRDRKRKVSCTGCWHVFLAPSGLLIFSWLVVFMYTKRMVPIRFSIAYLLFLLDGT